MKKKKIKIGPYGFIAPHLIIFSIFFMIPAVTGVIISFTQWDLYSTPKWVGFDNYYQILLNSDSVFFEQFYNGLTNTFTFALLAIPFCIIVPLILAVLLNSKPKGHKIFQSIFYVPGLLSISAVMLMWNFMFNKTFGLVNNVTGMDANWFTTYPLYWIALIGITVWWCIGSNMVIYQAAIANVSKDMYEAAQVDGAGPIRQFFSITLPSIKNQIIYTVVLTTIAQFNIYGQPLMFNAGGPNGANRVLMMYIQELAFGQGTSLAGIASAMAIMLGLCIMCVVLFQNLVLGDDDKKQARKNKKQMRKLLKANAIEQESANQIIFEQ